jgi:hypothetical protein
MASKLETLRNMSTKNKLDKLKKIRSGEIQSSVGKRAHEIQNSMNSGTYRSSTTDSKFYDPNVEKRTFDTTQTTQNPYTASNQANMEKGLLANGNERGTPLAEQKPYSGSIVEAKETGVGAGTGGGTGGGNTGGNTAQSYIDKLNEYRRQQTLAQLGKSRDAALSNLEQERTGIQPRYYDQRNQVAAEKQKSARNFAEFMAARGGTNAGSNAQAELSRNMSYQGNIGALNRQEAQAYDNIDRRTTDVQNAYQSDIASAEAGMQGDRMQMLLQDYYKARERGDRLAQLAIQNELARAGLTGNYEGGRTLAGQQFDYGQQVDNRNFDYQAGRDQVMDNRYDEQFDFQKSQQEWDNAFREGQFDFQKAQQLWDNNFKNKSFEQGIQQFSQQLGLDYTRLSQQQQRFVAEMAYKNEAMEYGKQQDAINNQFREKQWSADQRDQAYQDYLGGVSNRQEQQQIEMEQNDTAVYNMFLTDLPRIETRQEGIDLIQYAESKGASPEIIQKMLKDLNSSMDGRF